MSSTSQQQPLFRFIENNYVDDASLEGIRNNLLKSPLFKRKGVEDVSVVHSIHLHKEVQIHTITIMIFFRIKKDGFEPTPIQMTFIPVNELAREKCPEVQYFIIKDEQAFFNTDKSTFTFSIGNYNTIYSICKFTERYNTLESIVVNRLKIILKHQNQEYNKVIANMINLVPEFANELGKTGLGHVLDTPVFTGFLKKYQDILTHMIGNNILKYDNGYELRPNELGQLVDRFINPIIPIAKVNPLVKFKFGNEQVAFSVQPKLSYMKFPTSLPSDHWSNFLGGVTLSIYNNSHMSKPRVPSSYPNVYDPLPIFRNKRIFCVSPPTIKRKPDIRKDECPCDDSMEIKFLSGDDHKTESTFINWYETNGEGLLYNEIDIDSCIHLAPEHEDPSLSPSEILAQAIAKCTH